jgi:hypothetical protein
MQRNFVKSCILCTRIRIVKNMPRADNSSKVMKIQNYQIKSHSDEVLT